MQDYKMNWKNLLSVNSQRPRSSKTKNRQEPEEAFNESKEKSYSDLRSDFERDYHRILSSASFRRLQDKTQVFPLEKNDFIRTRLTHSIEVSSFARSLAQSVGDEIIKNNLDSDFGHEEANGIANILASSGLLHDIGNPPFGHFGEDTIRAWFEKNLKEIEIKDFDGKYRKLCEILNEQMCNDFIYFEGNAQAIRVVSKLHFLVDENGMNLTFALLNTLIKYPVNSLNIDRKSGDIKTKKMGYYYSEKELFENIVKSTGTYDSKTGEVYRHPLTFLLEAADDIAYCTADIEDGMKKGFISFENLIESLKINVPEDERLYKNLMSYKDYAKKKKYDSPELYAVQRWIVSIQGIFISSVVNSFIKNYDLIMNGEFKTDLFKGTEAEKLLNVLKKLAFKEVFEAKAILKMEIAANNIINYFLTNFVNSVLYWDTPYEEKMAGIDSKYIAILSENQRHIYKYYSELAEKNIRAKKSKNTENREDKEKENIIKEKEIFRYKLYLRLLLVTDYISGMTDSFIKTLYQELTGID
jgi:putative dGTPase